MQAVPPGICEAFFAGYCEEANCPLRHESEIPATESAPPPPQPQPAAVAMDTDTITVTETEIMQGVTTASPVTSGPDDADTLPSSEGKESASHPAIDIAITSNGLPTSNTPLASPPPASSGGERAAVRARRKVCKNYVKNGLCLKMDCTLEHPDEEDDDFNMEDLVDADEAGNRNLLLLEQQQHETAAAPAAAGNHGSSPSKSVQGEMLTDFAKPSPNGPPPSKITAQVQAESTPGRPDRSVPVSGADKDANILDIDDLPSEPEDELPSHKKRSPSPVTSPVATSPKRSKRDSVSPPPNPLDVPNTHTPDAVPIKASPSPAPSASPGIPTPDPVVIEPSPSPETPTPVAPLSRTNINSSGPRALLTNHVDDEEDMEIGHNDSMDINNLVPPSRAGNISVNGNANNNRFPRRGGRGGRDGHDNRGNRGGWRGRGRGNGRGNGNGNGRGRARGSRNATHGLNVPIPREDPVPQVVETFHCAACDKDCGSTSNYQSHVKSKKHLTKARQAELRKQNAGLQDLYRDYDLNNNSGNNNNFPTVGNAVTWGDVNQQNTNNTGPAEAAEDLQNGNLNDNDGPSYLADVQQPSNNTGGGNVGEDDVNSNKNVNGDEDIQQPSNNTGGGNASEGDADTNKTINDNKKLMDEDDDEDDIPRPSDLVSPVVSPVKLVASPPAEPVSLVPSLRVEPLVLQTDTPVSSYTRVEVETGKMEPSTRIQVAASPPRASSPPLPTEYQSPTSPLSFDGDEDNGPMGEDGDHRSKNNVPPVEPQMPSTVNTDTNMSVYLDPEKLPASGTMPDVLSPRSVSDQGTSPSSTGGKSSPPKSTASIPTFILPNVGVVGAAVITIERSSREKQDKGPASTTVPLSKPVTDATNINNETRSATEPEQRSDDGDSRPKAPRGSRFTKASPAEIQEKADKDSCLTNGHREKEDQQMNDLGNADAGTPMDTTNDEDAMPTDTGNGSTVQATAPVAANAEAYEDDANIIMEDGELCEDMFMPSRRPLGQAHVWPNIFDPSEAKEPPTIGAMKALRNIAMKGDRASQLAFKMMQELLISPTLGVGQQHLKPFMRALEKVPQYLNADGVPYSYWQHFHPALINQTPTPEQEYQYSVLDAQEETAIEVMSDNLGYIAHHAGTEDRDCSFMNDGKGPNIQVRGRYPTSKANHGEDDVTQDPLFRFLTKR